MRVHFPISRPTAELGLTLPLFGDTNEPQGSVAEEAGIEVEPGSCRVPIAPPLREPLIVDPVLHSAEISRFYAKVVLGPGEHCDIWAHGAISDDGYGTFSITRSGRRYTVKAHRYAVAHQLGIPVRYGQVIEHVVCDNPICVRAHPNPLMGHIWPSTQAENLRRMTAKGRGGRSGWWIRRWSGLARHERARRSRALAAAVRDGWDEDRVRAVLARTNPAQLGLFALTEHRRSPGRQQEDPAVR